MMTNERGSLKKNLDYFVPTIFMIYEKIIIYISSNRSYLRNVVRSVHDLPELPTISCKRAGSDDTKLQNYSPVLSLC